MNKIIIHNKSDLPLEEAMKYAAEMVYRTKNKLKKVGSWIMVEFDGARIKGEIILQKTCYTVVIS